MSPSRIDFTTASAAEVLAEAARRQRNRDAGRAIDDDGPTVVFVRKRKDAPEPVGITIPRRIEVTLPWSALCADNAKYAPAKRQQGGYEKPVIILSAQYRAAKRKAVDIVQKQLYGTPGVTSEQIAQPLVGELALEAKMFEPNRANRRDLTNYAKLVHDALTGLAYVDDSQLDRVTWLRGGVDIDRPRLELVITTL